MNLSATSLLAALLIGVTGCATTPSVRVVSVQDGDTLTVAANAQRLVIRLAEVDAPERTQPYSQVSRRNLVRLCVDAQEARFERVDLDRYGRTVAHVWCDGVHVNWQQVEDGLAWCFTRHLRHPEQCRPLEDAARGERRGLWRDDAPVSPWEFRQQQREQRQRDAQ